MNVMRFDAGVGDFTLGVREESVQLLKGMGTICLQLGLEVKAPRAQEVGRFLALQADLYGIHGSYQRTLLGRVMEMLPFSSETIERRTLKFLLTAAPGPRDQRGPRRRPPHGAGGDRDAASGDRLPR